MKLSSSLPPLPALNNQLWSPDARRNYEFLNAKYSHAMRVLQHTGVDEPTRLLVLAEDLNSKFGTLEVLAKQGLPDGWVEAVAFQCALLLRSLTEAAQLASGR